MLFESGGTLDASPQCDEETGRIAHGLCARFISVHAAKALQSTGIACLNLTHNQYLNNLPVKELCNMASLIELRCERKKLELLRPCARANISSSIARILPYRIFSN